MARQTMNFVNGEFFKVVSLNGSYGLLTNPQDEESVAGCRAVIDRHNERMKLPENVRLYGSKPERFLIVKHTWNKTTYPDGTFCEHNEKIKTVELYPEEL